MAEEIEIGNVGGRDGVASEATMQLLLSEFRNRSSSDSAAQKAQSRLIELNNRSTRDNTNETKLLTKAMKSAGSALKGLGKEAILGGDRLGDFASAAFGASSVLTRFVQFGDDTIDTLRGLTSVGASFNNNMFDMIGASANSAMNLGDFASMVQNNSATLATFGANVTSGARTIGQFSKDFRSGVGNELFSMGFTIGDVNEGLISFLDLERRRSLAGLRTDRLSQQAASDYILQLDKLTKLTGEEREQIADRLQQQLQDAGVRAQINRLDGTARDNFESSLAFIESQLSGPLADGLKDLMDGVAQTDLGKALQSQIPGIGQFAQQMFAGGKSVDEVIDAMTNRFGPQLEGLAGAYSKAQLDQMRMSGGVTGAIAEILDSSYQINQLVGRDAEAAAEEQRRRERITSTLGGFEQAITSARKFIIDAFLDSADQADGLKAAFGNLFSTVKNLFAPNTDGSLSTLGTTITEYFNKWFGTGGTVTGLINRFSTSLATTDWESLFNSIDNTFNSFIGWISELTTTYRAGGIGAALQKAGGDITNSILDLFLGAREILGDPRDGILGERQGGLIQNIYRGIMDNIISSSTAGSGKSFLDRIQDSVMDLLVGPTDSFGPGLIGENLQKIAFAAKIETLLNDYLGLSIIEQRTGGRSLIQQTIDNLNEQIFGSEETGPGFLTTVKNKLSNYLFPETSDISFVENVKNKLNDMLFGSSVGDSRDGIRVGGILESIANGFSELFQRPTILNSITNGFTNILNSADTALRNVLGLPTEGTLFESLKVRVLGDGSGPDLMTRMQNKLQDLLYGEVEGSARDGIRSGGLLDTIAQSFADLMQNNTVVTAMKDAITEMTNTAMNTVDANLRSMLGMTDGQSFGNKISEMVNEMTIKIINIFDQHIPRLINTALGAARRTTRNTFGGAAGSDLGTNNTVAAIRKLESGDISGEERQDLINTLRSLQRQRDESGAFANTLGMAGEFASDIFNTDNLFVSDQAILQSVQKLTEQGFIPPRAKGTLGATGETSEPEGGLMNIHKGERVLNHEETRAYNQSGSDNSLDKLNNTMMQVVALLSQGNQISERTAKGLRGMTNDYYRGLA